MDDGFDNLLSQATFDCAVTGNPHNETSEDLDLISYSLLEYDMLDSLDAHQELHVPLHQLRSDECNTSTVEYTEVSRPVSVQVESSRSGVAEPTLCLPN